MARMKLNDLKLKSFVTDMDTQKVLGGKRPRKTHEAFLLVATGDC